ncbi:MAG: helix-turn-helix domain-containing protein [Oscillospiraceae bacterium]|nr:helix-turn-helix domain-containing protein [Oscillospiraceae bacterium]
MNYLTKKQAAERLQISVRTLEGLISRGQLPAYRIGPKAVRIVEAELENYVLARQIAPIKATPKKAEAVRPCLYVPGMKVV